MSGGSFRFIACCLKIPLKFTVLGEKKLHGSEEPEPQVLRCSDFQAADGTVSSPMNSSIYHTRYSFWTTITYLLTVSSNLHQTRPWPTIEVKKGLLEHHKLSIHIYHHPHPNTSRMTVKKFLSKKQKQTKNHTDKEKREWRQYLIRLISKFWKIKREQIGVS